MKIINVDLYEEFSRKRVDGAKGRLTCYIPDVIPVVCEDRLYPAVLIIPGGGYKLVSPREAEPIALRYLAKGFGVFVLDYSVAPIIYPAAFLEAAMAMLYIRDKTDNYNIDNEKVAAMGFSAGGHLCGCLATLFDEEVITKTLGDINEKVRPDAVILSYPVITSGDKAHKGSFSNLCGDDEELKRELSLEDCVTANSSPAFIWHTYEDRAVSVKNSLLLANAYEANGVSFSLHIFEKGCHGLSTADWASYRVDNLPCVSTSLRSWIDISIEWLQDRGFAVSDILDVYNEYKHF